MPGGVGPGSSEVLRDPQIIVGSIASNMSGDTDKRNRTGRRLGREVQESQNPVAPMKDGETRAGPQARRVDNGKPRIGEGRHRKEPGLEGRTSIPHVTFVEHDSSLPRERSSQPV